VSTGNGISTGNLKTEVGPTSETLCISNVPKKMGNVPTYKNYGYKDANDIINV
jgi:hypothetical protein